MKTRAARFVARVGPFLLMTIGMIVFSQGPSFGRWNEFMTPSDNHNFHAVLLTLVGVGLFAGGLTFYHLLDRLQTLERRPDASQERLES